MEKHNIIKNITAIILAAALCLSLAYAIPASRASGAYAAASAVSSAGEADKTESDKTEEGKAGVDASSSQVKQDKTAIDLQEENSKKNGAVYRASADKSYDDLLTAIQEAKPGETIEFLVDEYQFTEEIVLIKPVCIAGMKGSGTTLLGYKLPNGDNFQSVADAFYIDCDAGDFEFEDLSFEEFGLYQEDGSKTTQNSIYGQAISISEAAAYGETAERGVQASATSGEQLSVNETESKNTGVNLTVKNCGFSRFGGQSALSVRGGNKIVVDGCTFDGAERSATAINLLEFVGGRDITVSNCTFKNVEILDYTQTSCAIAAFNSFMDGTDVTITNCTFNNCADSAIIFEGFQGEGAINYKIDSSNKFEKCGCAFTYATCEKALPEDAATITVGTSARGLTPVLYYCESDAGFNMCRVYYIDTDELPLVAAFCDVNGSPFNFAVRREASESGASEAASASEISNADIASVAEATASEAASPLPTVFDWNPEFNIWIQR